MIDEEQSIRRIFRSTEEYSEAQKVLDRNDQEEYDTIISRRILSDSHDPTESVINPEKDEKENNVKKQEK